MQDLRLAFRALRATPVVSIVAVLSLALGIGANTAIFCVSTACCCARCRSNNRTARIVTRRSRSRHHVAGPIPSGKPSQRATLFDGGARVDGAALQPVARRRNASSSTACARAAIFETLGVPALLGRTFTDADDQRGGGTDGPVAVISYGFWQRRFGGAADAIGTPLTSSACRSRSIGVTPPDSSAPTSAGRSTSRCRSALSRSSAGQDSVARPAIVLWLTVMVRLKPGQSLDAATAALRGVQPQIRDEARAHGLGADGCRRIPDGRVHARARGAPATRRCAALSAAAADDHGRRRARPADRLREHRQPAARARDRAASRVSVRLALGASRLATRAAIADREPCALGGRRRARAAVRALGQPRCSCASCPRQTNTVFLDLALDWRVLAFTAAVAVAHRAALRNGAGASRRGVRANRRD